MRTAPAPTRRADRDAPVRSSRVESGRLARARARQRRRRAAAAFVLLGAALLVGIDLLRGGTHETVPTSHTASAPSVAESAEPSAEPSPSAAPSPSPSPEPVYQVAGDIPASGPGTWTYATGKGDVLGTAGTTKRFRVAAEKNIADEELDVFTEMIEQTLGDPRSWIAGRQYRLQRVPNGSSYNFTVYLATGETTRRMCATGGMDTRMDGVSYTSCRLPGRVVINLNRWRLSVPDYVNGKIDLTTYRTYVINHEVGHELGRNHEACPGKGKPAPVMQQQTYGLKGCKANPWPYVDGKRYTGPPVA
ncbi:DUF3152 domain-containing protein [Catellatospora bangladeshensis]|uniref:DUF3152 domain-containing protein n=1 Tax=Catellatospora bangladeshensis TaxID=310355 RepID=A0A8J3JIY4_9ACTN|nr:DUF3152 domain-containing protein [Catellatospora bangladeshensis]GIF79428.1 hypothetical protein Cba03nite_07770 [Catellatospora bangladeshensis]